MTLGKLIAAYRKQEGLSVRQLAKIIGVDHVTLWRLENGNSKSENWPAVLRWVFGK